MDNIQNSNRNYEAIAWGAIFIWWGITELFTSLPEGSGALGIGLILLGVNGARAASGVPTSRFSLVIGILALVWGGLELLGVMVNLPFEIPIFPILLIVLGALILAPELKGKPDEATGALK
jgi:hypothetical protein